MVYFPEYDKEFNNSEGPGPGKYFYDKYNTSFSKNGSLKKGIGFSKVNIEKYQ